MWTNTQLNGAEVLNSRFLFWRYKHSTYEKQFMHVFLIRFFSFFWTENWWYCQSYTHVYGIQKSMTETTIRRVWWLNLNWRCCVWQRRHAHSFHNLFYNQRRVCIFFFGCFEWNFTIDLSIEWGTGDIFFHLVFCMSWYGCLTRGIL